MRLGTAIITISIFCLSSFALEHQPVWSPQQLNETISFSSEDKIVGTHYFYWYDYPDYHFYDDGAYTDDALQDHFPNPEEVSFNSIEWHEQQLQDCVEAGIDFIIPVYWGAVDNYFRRGVDFSIRGLGPLQTAIDRRTRAGKPSPKIGMFYDTSTLLPGMRGVIGQEEKIDLRQDHGKDIFYRTIRDYFYQIHPKHWAAIDGKPLVVLYSAAFAKAQDQSTFDYVYEQFPKHFHGLKPYIVKDGSWAGKTDAVTQWGAALGGPYIGNIVAQIGPGYNDMAVPGRSTPIREREDGNFYRWSWNRVLRSSVNIVLIETWNEMHEGTDICHSEEFGREYIELTREYSEKFKRGEKPAEKIELKHPDPLPRPASDVGAEYKDAQQVRIRLGHQGESQGIWLVRGQQDGPVVNAVLEDVHCVRTQEAQLGYMYFNVADPFFFNDEAKIEVEYTYWDDGFAWHQLQYDSYDQRATLSGAYKNSAQVTCEKKKQWVTRKITLDDARFVNRQNGGSDFRFAAGGGWLAIKEIVIRKLASIHEP